MPSHLQRCFFESGGFLSQLRIVVRVKPQRSGAHIAAILRREAFECVKGWSDYRCGEVAGPPARAVGLHERNFMECIKSRKRPNADIEIGRLSTTICHLGNISCRLGRKSTSIVKRNLQQR